MGETLVNTKPTHVNVIYGTFSLSLELCCMLFILSFFWLIRKCELLLVNNQVGAILVIKYKKDFTKNYDSTILWHHWDHNQNITIDKYQLNFDNPTFSKFCRPCLDWDKKLFSPKVTDKLKQTSSKWKTKLHDWDLRMSSLNKLKTLAFPFSP